MPSPRSVMIDISDFGLDPTVPYNTVGGSGRIKERVVSQKLAGETPAEKTVEAISHENVQAIEIQHVSEIKEVVACKEDIQPIEVVVEQTKVADVPVKEINALRELPSQVEQTPISLTEHPATAQLSPKKSRKKDKNTTQVT